MASDRDTLAALLKESGNRHRGLHYNLAYWQDVADDLVAAGVRPPAREITTLDELLDLPAGTIVRSSAGTIACRADLVNGVVFGDERPFPWARLALPAAVMPIPTEEAGRG